MKLIKLLILCVTAWFLGKANAIYIFYLRTKCMQMHKQTHKQYFIVPVANSKKIGPYTIMNVEQHNHYNKVAKKIGKPQISYKELLTMAVFKTPSGFLGVQRNIL